jgi:deoxyribonuclease V
MRWAREVADLERLQMQVAELATRVDPWLPEAAPTTAVGGVFATTGTGHHWGGVAGEEVWVGAVTLHGREVADAVVLRGRTGAAYRRGYLALVWGPLLEAAVRALDPAPPVVLVNATGFDHPRRGGLALHLGEVLDLPTIGVTDRPLEAPLEEPGARRGDARPLVIDGRVVGHIVRTRPGARPVCVHAGWRTDADAARDLVLAVTGRRSRTAEPLRRARRLARLRRALDEGRVPAHQAELTDPAVIHVIEVPPSSAAI